MLTTKREYIYGSNATKNALNLNRAYRAAMNNTAKRGPRPGIEVKVDNAFKAKIANKEPK